MLQLTPAVWWVTIGLIVVLLAIDLVLAAARPHRVGFREAAAWSVFYIAVAVGFGIWSHRHLRLEISAPSTSPATWSRRACRSTTSSSS